MNRKLRWITETAVMLALLVALQALARGFGQIVTGSFVNAILAITALVSGLSGALTVAIISPVLAYLLGIAPQLITVPAIMIANAVFVVLMYALAYGSGRKTVSKVMAWVISAAAKFLVLYAVVVLLICGVFSPVLLDAGLLKQPMLKVLPAAFSWLQLVTALIGGGAALLMAPLLRKIRNQI